MRLRTFFWRKFSKLAIAEYQLPLIIVDLDQEEIVAWNP